MPPGKGFEKANVRVRARERKRAEAGVADALSIRHAMPLHACAQEKDRRQGKRVMSLCVGFISLTSIIFALAHKISFAHNTKIYFVLSHSLQL